MNYVHTAKILGGGITKRVDDRVVMFYDAGSTYMLHTEAEGYAVPYPGRYRVTVDAKPYQADTPVVLTLYQGIKQGTVASLDDLIGAFDLLDDTARVVEVTTFMRPGDLLAPSVAELDRPPGDYVNYFAPDKTVANYRGEGVAIKSLTVEGPLIDQWPPPGTRRLFAGLSFDDAGSLQTTKSVEAHVLDIVRDFARRAFRRPLEAGEAEAYADLAAPTLAAGRPLEEAVRVSLRAILSAPSFLYQTGAPGALGDYALAARLSYFLWRSMPDDELFALARRGRLAQPDVLTAQVDRMLDDARSQRFVKDFAGQAFRLYELNRTTPDGGLYPEYDARLGQAMASETELFLGEMIERNHGVGHLVDADFTYVNRRLAEHYGLADIKGQHMRRVVLPADSPRGGVLTQASIHKITANGTVSSPVPRGNFVLANILGRPAPPPPPGIAGLEPDIRGTTTVREQLAAHRANAVCNSCHQSIDPPGFALESFDPIGGFRTHYRASRGEMKFGDFSVPRPYAEGPAVDPSGVTPHRRRLRRHRGIPADPARQGTRPDRPPLRVPTGHAGDGRRGRVRGPRRDQAHRGLGRRPGLPGSLHHPRGRPKRPVPEAVAMPRAIDRRSFLRAAGVALALPFLPSLRPAFAIPGERPRRMVNICATLGLYSDSWFPKTAGADYEPSEYLSLIDEHRDHYTLFSGLCHEQQTGRQAHNSEITWLTSAKHPGLDGFQNTISVDQVVADHYGYVTRFPSIVLGTYSAQSQSYTGNGVMVPAETSPARLFAEMFLVGKPEEVERETRRLRDGRSILDTLGSQTASLKDRMSDTDRKVLDAYFEAVRIAERDLVEVQAWTKRPKPVVDATPPTDIADNADVIGRVRLLFDLIPLILATDSSRVVSVMIQDHQTVPAVPGVTADQHNLSHHGQDQGKIDQLRIIEREIVGRFGELLAALREQEDGDGSILDHTTLLFGSNLGNANSHVAVDLPILLAGGPFKHGGHIVHEGEANAPLCNLFVTMLRSVGVEADSFGQSTGALTWG